MKVLNLNMVGTYLTGALLLGSLFAGSANAAPIVCDDASVNHMKIDDSEASACLGAGVGNISGNPATDDWLTTASGAGYTLVSKDDGVNPFNIMTAVTDKEDEYTTGTWSIDSSYWLTHSSAALGFKFGTGNQPDEWFIFDLVSGVSSGTWRFENFFEKGGELSHTNLYSNGNRIPEPTAVTLLGLGLVVLGLARRKARG